MYCDLSKLAQPREEFPASVKVEQKTAYDEVAQTDLDEILSIWNPEQAKKEVQERFRRNASLWLVKTGGKLAGFVWTLRGDTMVPHFFPLGADDAHFFDLFIFPRYRGRAMNWVLITHVLYELAASGVTRAYSDVKEWNKVSLTSFEMTPFQSQGSCRRVVIFGRSFVSWGQMKQTRN